MAEHNPPSNVGPVDPEVPANVRRVGPGVPARVRQEERPSPTSPAQVTSRRDERLSTTITAPSPRALAIVRRQERSPRRLKRDPTHLLSVQVESQPPSRPPTTTTTSSSSSRGGGPTRRPSPGRHPTFRGIRNRSGKWVSEIREPRKTSRIWLGTYPTPEMAAAAFDVAALALKGADAVVNFPDRTSSYPSPASPMPADIRRAASAAALLMKPDSGESSAAGEPESCGGNDVSANDAMVASEEPQEYVDEEALFDMPNILVDMAGGMLMSPPQMNPALPDDDSPEDTGGDDLWSYR